MAKRKLTKAEKSKSFSQISRKILSMPIGIEDFERLKKSDVAIESGATHDEVIVAMIVKKAMEGDIKAVQYIRELACETKEDMGDDKDFEIKFVLKVEGDKGE